MRIGEGYPLQYKPPSLDAKPMQKESKPNVIRSADIQAMLYMALKGEINLPEPNHKVDIIA